jgi:hypothetical protein
MAGQYADLHGGLQRWNGAAWTPVYDPIANGGNLPQVTSTTRPANSPSGKLVYETDSGAVALFSAGGWQHQPGVIARQVLSAPTTAVTFSAIPQVYRDLRLVISAKSSGNTNTGNDIAYLRFNNDTGTNYNWNSYSATQGATAVTVANAWNVSASQCAAIWNSYYPTPGRAAITIDIPNYADTNNVKVFVGKASMTDGGAAGMLQTFCGARNSSSAVTSITLSLTALLPIVLANGTIAVPVSPFFQADSTFTLYGLG